MKNGLLQISIIFAAISIVFCVNKASTPCVCSKELSPVCSTDGKTHPSPCLFECEKKIHPELKIKHVGECNRGDTPCVCTKELSPVCSTDGKTHHSPCLFECEKKIHPELKIKHVGACNREDEAK